MLSELRKLYEAGILAPAGFYRLVTSLFRTGINPVALLSYGAKSWPARIAITDERGSVSYADLYAQCCRLSAALHGSYNVSARQRVGIICRNHAALVKALFSVSQLGAHVYLLNADMAPTQLSALLKKHAFHLVIYDAELAEAAAPGQGIHSLPAYHDTMVSVDSLCRLEGRPGPLPLRRVRAGDLVVLTGGTTGVHKTAARKPGIMRFVSPFCALLLQARLGGYSSVYIATPVYHGYGLAAVFVSLALGSRMFFTQRFRADKACALIAQHNIEVVALVPVMLRRMLPGHVAALGSLQCIITGGAAIAPSLVTATIDCLGARLFNLYGTSEAGIAIMATPADLQYDPATIGRPIAGVQLRITDDTGREVPAGSTGHLCISNSWSVTDARNTWIDTGDMARRDANGYVFLHGRSDDMIVSGGENVYPITLENVLLQHPLIAEAAVIGVNDAEFGQRLKAFVVLQAGAALDSAELAAWLSCRVARFQMPVGIEQLLELPYTPLGKPDKRRLAGTEVSQLKYC